MGVSRGLVVGYQVVHVACNAAVDSINIVGDVLMNDGWWRRRRKILNEEIDLNGKIEFDVVTAMELKN